MKCPKCKSIITNPNKCSCGWENKQAVMHRCADPDCGLQHGLTRVNQNGRMLCGWHYTREFEKPHLMMLARQLKKIGLERRKKESMKDWGARCKQWIKSQGGFPSLSKAKSMR